MIGLMLFPMNPMPFSPVCTGDAGLFITFGTTGITTMHATVRGT